MFRHVTTIKRCKVLFILFNLASHYTCRHQLLSCAYSPSQLLVNKSRNTLHARIRSQHPLRHTFQIHLTTKNQHDNDNNSKTSEDSEPAGVKRRRRLRSKVRNLAKGLIQSKPVQGVSGALPMPRAVAKILQSATMDALETAVEAVVSQTDERERGRKSLMSVSTIESLRTSASTSVYDVFNSTTANITIEDAMGLGNVPDLLDEAFGPLEQTLENLEHDLQNARKSLQTAKLESLSALAAVQAAALAQAQGAAQAVVKANELNRQQVLADLYVMAQEEEEAVAAVASTDTKISTSELSSSSVLAPEAPKVDYDASEMAPPFLDEDSCLIPGEPIIRVEKAPENARRIFAGIDIPHSVDQIWNILTDYDNLSKVVPNLIVNDVLERFNYDTNDGTAESYVVSMETDPDVKEEVQCRTMAEQMRGAKLRQVGGAKVAGLQFSARTVLEVREWPDGMPDFAHFTDAQYQGMSRQERANTYQRTKLTRYRFPRPFAISSLPTKDISMQRVPHEPGEFREYQGVWRMQPLLGCGPPGVSYCRLTYAVEVSPKAYLPVSLIEGRIVRDLTTNLVAIRDYLETQGQV